MVPTLAHQPFSYMLTPNVDTMVHFFAGDLPKAFYHGASARLCDSRILTLMARLRGKRLTCYPGSDLVADLLADGLANGLTIGIVGPDRNAFARLEHLYPRQRFLHIPSARRLEIGSADWGACIEATMAAEWDILLSCVGFPKQELLVSEIAKRGRGHGVALCVGAAIDFLTGVQSRAPVVLQRLGLEWLYRLVRHPRRLWRRYLLTCPRIVAYYVRQEFAGEANA